MSKILEDKRCNISDVDIVLGKDLVSDVTDTEMKTGAFAFGANKNEPKTVFKAPVWSNVPPSSTVLSTPIQMEATPTPFFNNTPQTVVVTPSFSTFNSTPINTNTSAINRFSIPSQSTFATPSHNTPSRISNIPQSSSITFNNMNVSTPLQKEMRPSHTPISIQSPIQQQKPIFQTPKASTFNGHTTMNPPITTHKIPSTPISETISEQLTIAKQKHAERLEHERKQEQERKQAQIRELENIKRRKHKRAQILDWASVTVFDELLDAIMYDIIIEYVLQMRDIEILYDTYDVLTAQIVEQTIPTILRSVAMETSSELWNERLLVKRMYAKYKRAYQLRMLRKEEALKAASNFVENARMIESAPPLFESEPAWKRGRIYKTDIFGIPLQNDDEISITGHNIPHIYDHSPIKPKKGLKTNIKSIELDTKPIDLHDIIVPYHRKKMSLIEDKFWFKIVISTFDDTLVVSEYLNEWLYSLFHMRKGQDVVVDVKKVDVDGKSKDSNVYVQVVKNQNVECEQMFNSSHECIATGPNAGIFVLSIYDPLNE
jgi:sulfur relay (sulfurtransferase) DsrC/TusE family protein